MDNEQTIQLLTNMSASFALQSVVQGISEFDGKNIPLKDFIQDIRNAAALITDPQREHFVRLIITKLRGPARDCIYGKTIESPENLIKALRNRFAPCKDFAYYDSRIHSSRMKPGDSVGDYYDKLNISLNCAENALKDQLGNTYNEVIMAPLKTSVIRTFINGLPRDIGDLVDTKQPNTLQDAYKEALRIETRNNSRPKNVVDHSHTESDRGILNSDGARQIMTVASPSVPTKAQIQEAKTLLTKLTQQKQPLDKRGVPPVQVLTILKRPQDLSTQDQASTLPQIGDLAMKIVNSMRLQE